MLCPGELILFARTLRSIEVREYKVMKVQSREVRIQSGSVILEGELSIPETATGIFLFVHGSGSSRHSPRNQYVAQIIRQAGVATLLFDLLTREEEAVDLKTRHLRFDIRLLASRLIDATARTQTQDETRRLRVGYFGSSTGAAAALVAAAEVEHIDAIVSRGGRPDLAAMRYFA
jgi:putative phosphoribosyl transferase